MMLEPRFFTTEWKSVRALRRERYYDLLCSSETAAVFDQKFLEGLLRRREELAKLSFRLTLIQIPLIAFLAFALIPIDVNIPILTMSAKDQKPLREIVIVASALVALYGTYISMTQEVLSQMVGVHADRISKGNKDVREFLGTGYGIDLPLFPIASGTYKFGWGFTLFVLLYALAVAALLIIGLGVSLYVHYLILKGVYYDPSYSFSVSLFVIAIVLTCDFITLGSLVFLKGVVRIRSFENLMKLSRLEEREPKKAKKIYLRMALAHRKKPWLVRQLTRVKMPKKLPEN